MSEVPVSLLASACSRDDPSGWRTLADLYAPLFRRWLLREGVPEQYINTAVDSVLSTLAEKLPKFHEDRSQSFRGRVRKITADYLRAHWRVSGSAPVATVAKNYEKSLDDLEDAQSSLSRMWDKEHDEYISNCLLKRIKPEFKPEEWNAFVRLSRDGGDPQVIAEKLGMTLHAAYAARGKVLNRMRSLGNGMID